MFSAVASNHIYLFTRQFAAMISSRLPLVRSLENLSRETPNRRLRTALETVAEDMYAGGDLSDALARHPRIFGAIYVSIVRAGLNSGQLAESLERLTDYLKRVDELSSKMKWAILYPAFVCAMFFAVFNAMVFLILPRFQMMFSTLNRELPEMTRTMIAIGDFYSGYWAFLLGGAVAIAGIFLVWISNEDGRYIWDETKLKIPLVGGLVRNAVLSRFLWTFAVQLKNHIPAVQALRLSAEATDNMFLRGVVHEMADDVEAGSTLGAAFQHHNILGDIVGQMVSTGEEAGTVDELLMSAAGYFDTVMLQRLNAVTAMVNPLLTALVGLGIALMLIAAFLPVFEMSGNIS